MKPQFKIISGCDISQAALAQFGDGMFMPVRLPGWEYPMLLLPGIGPVALATTRVSTDEILLTYLEVMRDRRGHGYGRRLLSRIFAHAAQSPGRSLAFMGYTDAGRHYLQRHMVRLERRYRGQVDVVLRVS